MYMIYWTVIDNDTSIAHGQPFDSDRLREAMEFMEKLRARQRGGEAIRFVTMSSEHPHSVGPSGVAEPNPGYNWKKRRK